MDGEGGLSGTLRTINLYDATLWIASDAERSVKGDAASGYYLHILDVLVAELHDSSLAEIFLYFRHRGLESFELSLLCESHFFFLLCHNMYVFYLIFKKRLGHKSRSCDSCRSCGAAVKDCDRQL